MLAESGASCPVDAILTLSIHVPKEDGDRDERMVLEYIAHWVHIGRRVSLSAPRLSATVRDSQEAKYVKWYTRWCPTPQKYVDDKQEFLKMLRLNRSSMAMHG